MSKLHQKTYFCPECENEMEYEENSASISNPFIRCTNKDCEVWGMSWDIPTLESFTINQEQRLMEILEDE